MFNGFKVYYLDQGLHYNDYIKYALGAINFKICTEDISRSEIIIGQNVDRVVDLLKKQRRKIIRYFTKLGSLDIEAAHLLLAWHECRISRKPTEPGREWECEAYLSNLFDHLAKCANDYGIFTHDISANTLRRICEYTAGATISCANITHGAYFFALLERFGLLDTNWRAKMTKAHNILNKSGEAPSVRLLTTSVNKVGLTERLSAVDAPGAKDFYDKITKSVKEIFLYLT